MTLDRSGLPFIAAAGLPAVVLAALGLPLWALPFAGLAAFFLFFFRDPSRRPPAGDRLVLAPADGRVLVAGDVEASDPPDGSWRQISIFLSPVDVHINRAPVRGRVVYVERRPGRFLAAYRPESSTENTRTEVGFTHDGALVVCRQIVGVLARRIVYRVTEGQEVQAGDRFGIMKFGSRIDLFLPRTATIAVTPGQRVRGGETVVARLAGGEQLEEY